MSHVYDQVAHVFADLLSLVDDDTDGDDSFVAQVDTAQARAFDLGAIQWHVDDAGVVHVDPTNLMAGALSAIVALFNVAAEHGIDRDTLIAEWREQIDSD